MKLSKFFLFILVFIFLSFYCYSQKIHTIAVVPFKSNVLSEEEAKIFSDILENRLAQSNIFNPVERELKERIIDEYINNLEYESFYDEENFIELGKLLSTQWLVYGDINEIDDKFILIAQIINIETGEIISAYDGIVNNKLELFSLTSECANAFISFFDMDKKHSIDLSLMTLIQYQYMFSIGLNLGYSYEIIDNISVGFWGSVYLKQSDLTLGLLGEVKIIIGDTENIALSLSIGSIPSIGIYYKNFYLDYFPLIFMGYDGSFGISLGYSIGI